MKKVMIFSILIVAHMSCNFAPPPVSQPSEDVFNNISERFKFNDYIGVSDVTFINPYEEVGRDVESLFLKMIQHPLSKEIKRPPLSMSKTLSIQDRDHLAAAKRVINEVLESEGYPIREEQLEELNTRLSSFAFTSEGIISMLKHLESTKSLTEFEHNVIKLELQELTTAKTQAQIQNICATVEYEVYNSQLSLDEKEKLLYINSVVRNSVNTPLQVLASLPLMNLSDGPVFLQTAGSEYIVLGVVLLILSIDAWVNALYNPNCLAPCQAAAASAAVAWGFIGVAYMMAPPPEQ